MVFSLVLVAIAALWFWYKKTHYNDSPWVKNRIKGRNADQQAVIRYFCNEPACLSKKPISDEEYDAMVKKMVDSVDFRKKALDKLNVDEDEVKEIEPVRLEGYVYDEKTTRFAKRGDDGNYRSSQYQISWLFFSDREAFIYQNTFHMDEDGRKERTETYFYKDITNFSTISDTEEVPQYDPKQDKTVLVNVNSNRFAITVPGDRFYCSMEQNEYTDRSIRGMQSKLREKKS